MKKILFTLLAGILILSCNKDFLDVEPQASLKADEALTSETALGLAANGLYSVMKGDGYYGRYMIVYPDLMGNICVDANELNRGEDPYLHQMTDGTPGIQTLYSAPYDLIIRASNIINAEVEPNNIQDQDAVDNYVGQAYAARALGHFDLVRLFAQPYGMDNGASLGVPIITEEPDIDYQPARNTVAEVYAQILTDLDSAINRLNNDHIDNTQLTQWGAKALLAKVQLYMENWAGAIATATDVIDNGGFALDGDGYDTFGDASSESIFQIANTDDDNRGSNSIYSFYQSSYYYFGASTQWYSEFDSEDGRRSDWHRNRSGYQRPDKQRSRTYDIVVLRLAEMYLIRAEANAKLPVQNVADVQADLLTVLNRSYEPDLTNIDIPETGAALITRVLYERKKELCYEGNDIFDINRNGLPMTREYNTISAPAYGSTMILPIPKHEMDANKNMVQNNGY